MEARSYIIRDGQSHPDCAVLMSGFAFRHTLAIDGGRQIVSFHVPDEAHLFLAAADHNVQVVTQVDLASVPRKALHTLIDEHPTAPIRKRWKLDGRVAPHGLPDRQMVLDQPLQIGLR